MARKPVEEGPKEDPFIAKLQKALETSLDTMAEPKDLNALFANCVKFLQVKHKIKDSDDGGDFFGGD